MLTYSYGGDGIGHSELVVDNVAVVPQPVSAPAVLSVADDCPSNVDASRLNSCIRDICGVTAEPQPVFALAVLNDADACPSNVDALEFSGSIGRDIGSAALMP